MSAAALLDAGLAELGMQLSPAAREGLLSYLALIRKWNRVYNLTAIRDEHEAVRQHLLDSLAVLSCLNAYSRIADVGSGAGLPGIVLALARPSLAVDSIETVNKKASFQQQAAMELGLQNFRVINRRVEDMQVDASYDAVISRAFASLTDFIAMTAHLLAPGGHWLAMKGVYPQAEIGALPENGVGRVRSVPLTVPGLDAERHLIIVERA